jgi:transposase
VRALPGEKTDTKDGKRLASLMRHGLIRPSFVPSRDIRELRDMTRYRKKLLANGTAERNRIQKILEDANIKLGSGLTDVFGVSGQRMLHAWSRKNRLMSSKWLDWLIGAWNRRWRP